jgi:hypothetical protein
LREEAERERLCATQERKRAEREKKLRKRERYATGLFVLGLFLIAAIGWKYYQDLSEAKKSTEERSHKFLERAQEINRSTDPIRDAKELWNLSVALRYDIHNAQAARRACELLYGKNWCVPMIANLHHTSISGNNVLCAATLGPKGSQAKIFAVAEDGKLLVWREGKPALIREKDLFATDDQSGTDETHAPTPTAAFFSDDGKWLLVIPTGATLVVSTDSSPGAAKPSKPQEEPLEAEIWRWSPAIDSYERFQQHVKLNGRNSVRTVAWSSDGSILGVASYISGWGKSFCQVFKREGSSYVPISDASDRLTTDKVVALCFDFHNRWLATASYDGSKGMVELWDTVSFASVGTAPGGQTVFPVDGRPAAIASGPGENELTIAITGGPIQVLDLTAGKLRPSFSPTKRDQYARIIFGPEHSGRRLEDIILYKRIIAAENANKPRSEPICFQGSIATAKFSDDGKKIMTLSGDNLNAFDTIRIWGAPLPDPLDGDNEQFTGENPPTWLADLAELVSGLETPFGYETATSSSRDKISNYSKDVKDEYKKILQRFEPIMNDL